jgi:glycerol-3-phosphate dehydrogenase
MLGRLRAGEGAAWDVLVVGGGATGLGVALDASLRGYRTALVEAGDFGQGTSSRSTKLIHGGVRYLRQGDVAMVVESLRERGRLVRNAPGLVRPLPFLIPGFRRWEVPYYRIGMGVYDLLAGGARLGPSRALGRDEVLEVVPGLAGAGLRGGVVYYDAQFDDARMAVALAVAAAGVGAVPANYVEVVGLLRRGGAIAGARVRDVVGGGEFDLAARVVVNATGVFADALRRMDDPDVRPRVRPSRGTHIVLDGRYLGGDAALMIPSTDDGRVVFAIPFHGKVLVGTTDTEVEVAEMDPGATGHDIDYLLEHAGRYFSSPPGRGDVLSTFAGLRPLVAAEARSGGQPDSARLSRKHVVEVSTSGLVSVMGGKWTTFRQMAEDATDRAALVGQLPKQACLTADHPLGPPAGESTWSPPPAGASLIHPALPYTEAEVLRAVRDEMAIHLDDVLARRTRALVLDARAALEAAPAVARTLAAERGQPQEWCEAEVQRFRRLVERALG